MILRRLLPEPFIEFDLESTEGRTALESLYAVPESTWLRLNLIASVNGYAAGDDGTSESLTNRVDRRILGTIRRLADTVLVGAQSVRAEGYFVPKTATLAILTGSGDLSGHQIPSDVPEGKVIVLCPTTAVAMVNSTLDVQHATIIELPATAGTSSLDLGDAIVSLHELGHRNIVCEGGPTLAGQLIESGLVNEICLSTSPQLSAATIPVLPGLSSSLPLRLVHLLSDPDGHLFARWQLATR